MEAAENYPYILSGEVVRGKGAGHKHGLPTANIAYGSEDVLPPHGVYGGYAYVNGERWRCVTNVGLRPSDDDSPVVTVEALLLDFDRDIYGCALTVELWFFLRGVRKFPGGLDDVRRQVNFDSQRTRELLDEREARACQQGESV